MDVLRWLRFLLKKDSISDFLNAKTVENEHTKYQIPFPYIVANGIPCEHFFYERRSAMVTYSTLVGCITPLNMISPIWLRRDKRYDMWGVGTGTYVCYVEVAYTCTHTYIYLYAHTPLHDPPKRRV